MVGVRFNVKGATAAPSGTTKLVTAGVGAADDTLTSLAQIVAYLLANVPTGADGRVGSVALVNGAVTVATTAIGANSIVFVTYVTPELASTGVLGVVNVVAGTSFDITSSNGTDNSTVVWLIIN